MIKNKRICTILIFSIIAFLSVIPFHTSVVAKEAGSFKVPNHVLSIAQENTFSNVTENEGIIEPSVLTKELIESQEIPIDNLEFIKMLNETSIKTSPVGVGYRGMIYMGRWALNYQSKDTKINWEYEKVNENTLSNGGGDVAKTMHYEQEQQKIITGALINKVTNPEQIKSMMILTAKQKTNLPLDFQAVFGKGTKKGHTYTIQPKKYGVLEAYGAALHEKGEATFGEVYIELKGSKKSIVIKNITKQNVAAWIPIQDYVSFSLKIQ